MVAIGMGFIEVGIILAVVAAKMIFDFFKDLVAWIQTNVIPVLKDLLGKAFNWIKVFVKKVEPTVKKLCQVVTGYAKEAGMFIKKTVSRIVDVAGEVHEDIKKRLEKAKKDEEVDVSDVLELQLS